MEKRPESLCETCAAFIKVREDPSLGKVGECALEIFKPPLRASSTCTRHRPKGALGAAPLPRAAGEPRGRGRARAPLPIVRGREPSHEPAPPIRNLPQETTDAILHYVIKRANDEKALQQGQASRP